MTAITFGYKALDQLTSKGFTKEQAEGILEVFQDADLSRVATKDDIQGLYRFIITVAGVQVAAVGILLALFRFA